jgi:hypothetical protein
MRARFYRLTIIGCVLSSFLVGLHLPALQHELTYHGRTPHWTVLSVVSFLALVTVAGLWSLLRGPVPGATPPGPGAPAA